MRAPRRSQLLSHITKVSSGNPEEVWLTVIQREGRRKPMWCQAQLTLAIISNLKDFGGLSGANDCARWVMDHPFKFRGISEYLEYLRVSTLALALLF
jgi:hypothetical protein